MGEWRLLIIPGDDKALEIFFPQKKKMSLLRRKIARVLFAVLNISAGGNESSGRVCGLIFFRSPTAKSESVYVANGFDSGDSLPTLSSPFHSPISSFGATLSFDRISMLNADLR